MAIITIFKIKNKEYFRKIPNDYLTLLGCFMKGDYLGVNTKYLWKVALNMTLVDAKPFTDIFSREVVEFVKYMSTDGNKYVEKQYSNLHKKLMEKGYDNFVIIKFNTNPFSYGHKKSIFAVLFSPRKYEKVLYSNPSYILPVIITMDFNGNIKKIIHHESFQRVFGLLPYTTRTLLYYNINSFTYLTSSLFLLNSIIHSNYYTVDDILKISKYPETWLFTVLNLKFHSLLRYRDDIKINIFVKKSLQSTPQLKYEFTIVDPPSNTYNIGVSLDINTKANSLEVLPEIFALSDYYLVLKLLSYKDSNKLQSSEHIIKLIDSVTNSGVRMDDLYLFYKTSKLIFSKTNIFKILKHGLSCCMDDFKISTLSLTLDEKETRNKTKLPLITRIETDNKRFYIVNLIIKKMFTGAYVVPLRINEMVMVINKKGVNFEKIHGGSEEENNDLQVKPERYIEFLANNFYQVFSKDSIVYFSYLKDTHFIVKFGDDVILFPSKNTPSMKRGVSIFTEQPENTFILLSGLKYRLNIFNYTLENEND